MPKVSPKAKASWFGFPITISPNVNFTRNKLVEFLDENKIGTRLLFGGNLLKQPYMKNQHYKIIGDLKNSDVVVNNTFWIGVYPGLGNEELSYVLEIFHKFLKINQN